MTSSPAPLWWQAPLVTGPLTAAPWLAPWQEPAAYAALLVAFADPALYSLAAGLGAPPTTAYLRTVMSAPADVHLWRPLPGAGGVGPLWVHSTYTSLHRVACWAAAGEEAHQDLWEAGIASLTAAVFAHERGADAGHVLVDLASPAPSWQEDFLVGLGFDPPDGDDPGVTPHAVWLVNRAAHALAVGG